MLTFLHNVVYCADASEYIVVELGDDAASAVLMSDFLTMATGPTPVCLSFHYSVGSLDVIMTVALSASSEENLANSSHVVVATHSHGHWRRSFEINADERLFITASKLGASTRRPVTYAFVSNVSLTPGNCSSDAASGKSFRITESGLHECLRFSSTFNVDRDVRVSIISL